MSRRCSICSHPSALDINKAYVQGKTVREIARVFAVSEGQLYSHINGNHLSRQMVTHYKNLELQHTLDLKAEIDEIIGITKKILKRNYHKKNDYLALKAVSEQRNTYSLLVQISSMLLDVKKFEFEQNKEEQQAESDAEYSKKLQVLNIAELEMLMKLQLKVYNQSKDIIIPYKDEFQYVDYEPVSRSSINEPLKRTRNTPKDKDTPKKRNKSADKNKHTIQRVQPDTIPHTSWKHHPDNRNRTDPYDDKPY